MRRRDWQGGLEAWVRVCRDRPFAWGVNDCCTFAMGAVAAVTGADLLGEWLGRYASEREALRLIAHGGGLEALVDARIGERIAPLLAAPGDIGMFHEGRWPALCVNGGGHWLAPGAAGLAVIDSAAVDTAWRCERG